MASRFWRRYRPSGAGFSSGSGGGGAGSRGNTPLLQDLADRAAYFVKAVAAIYIVRENLVEFTVVSFFPVRPVLVFCLVLPVVPVSPLLLSCAVNCPVLPRWLGGPGGAHVGQFRSTFSCSESRGGQLRGVLGVS